MQRYKQSILILLSLAALPSWLCSGSGSTALATQASVSAPQPQQPGALPGPRAHVAASQRTLETKNCEDAKVQFELAIQTYPKLAEADLNSEFTEDVRKELQPSDPK